MNKLFQFVVNVITWIIFAFIIILVIGYFFGNPNSPVSGFILLLVAIFMMPIALINNFWDKVLTTRKWLKHLILILLFFSALYLQQITWTPEEKIAYEESLPQAQNKHDSVELVAHNDDSITETLTELIEPNTSNTSEESMSTQLPSTDASAETISEQTSSTEDTEENISVQASSGEKTEETYKIVTNTSPQSKESSSSQESFKNLLDDVSYQNFKQAATSIGLDCNDIVRFSEIDDWASGKRYSFVYHGFDYLVYIFDNGEISSISDLDRTVKIYEKGYEPLNYKDFEPDYSILDSLTESALKTVSNYIYNDTSLKLKTGSSIIYRIYDYYSLTGEAIAKNKVDRKDISFTVDFLVNGSNATVSYVAINGESKFGSKDNEPNVQKVKISSNEVSSSSDDQNELFLSDGEVGEYGHIDLFDGEEYIRYYVPAGTYEVTSIVRGGFYIESITLHKEDGWDTATTYSQYTMSSNEKTKITIKDGQCISLYLGTELKLTRLGN